MDIGGQLRQAREARGLSLDDIQKATRIKRVFLEAIEAGRFDELPGPVQARGFVRSYANHVGIDPDPMLAQMDGGVGEPATRPLVTARDAARAEPARDRLSKPALPTARSLGDSLSGLPLPLPLLIIGAILLFIVGGILILQAFGGEAPAPTETLPSSVPASSQATPEDTPVTLAATGVSVTLTAAEHVWVRISNDGFTAFEGLLEPGEPQTWQGQQQIIVETGNGAALSVAANGQDLGVLGPRNRVVIRAWGPEGEVTPAPTAAPTPANTEAPVEPTTTPSP